MATELATVAHTEATAFLTVTGMVATDSPMEATAVATTARGRLSLLLLPRLKLTLTIALTDMVDTDFPTEATHVHTPLFLTVAGMVATDSPTEDMEAMVVATMARGRLRLRLMLRLKQRLRSVRTVRGTGPTAMAAATEATADPMVDTVATTAAMGMAILPTTTRQHLEHRHHTNNPNLLKYELEKIKFDVFQKKKKKKKKKTTPVGTPCLKKKKKKKS